MKTNAMRILDKNKTAYIIHEYDSEGAIDGVSVALKINKPSEMVYKALITKGKSEHYCFVIPVEYELNLGFAAKATGEKSIAMIKQADLLSVTGYIKGGCSPVGQKKKLKTFIASECELLDSIIVSGVKIGLQLELAVSALISETNAILTDLI